MNKIQLTAETGVVSVPLREWSRLRRLLREEWNRLVDADLALLRELQARAVAHARGLRHVDRHGLLLEFYREHPESLRVLPDTAIVPLLLEPAGEDDHRFRVICPGELPWATQRTREFAVTPQARILVAEAPARELHWIVDEGERTVEQARQSPMGRAFFQLLENQVIWGRTGHSRFDLVERWVDVQDRLASPA